MAGRDAAPGEAPLVATCHLRLEWPTGGKRAKAMTAPALKEHLERYGHLVDLLLVVDKSRAFVSYASVQAAAAAKAAMHEQVIKEFSWLKVLAVHVDVDAAVAQYAVLEPAPTGAAISPLEAVAHLEACRPHGSLPPHAYTHTLPGIPGLILIHNFLTEAEEDDLVRAIDGAGWTPQLSRRVQHYGKGFDYRTRTVPDGDSVGVTPPPATPMLRPIARIAETLSEWGFVGDEGDKRLDTLLLRAPLKGLDGLRRALSVAPRLEVGRGGPAAPLPHPHPLARGGEAEDGPPSAAHEPEPPHQESGTREPRHPYPVVDQVTVNEYDPGRGIAGHIDTHSAFQDGIISVSALDSIVMEFSWAVPEGGAPTGGAVESCPGAPRRVTHHVVLPRRCLLVLRGEARHAWSHRIATRSTDMVDNARHQRSRRVSVTLRAIRQRPCVCAWPRACFDQDGGSSEPAQLFSHRLQQEKDKVEQQAFRERHSGEDGRESADPAPVGVEAALATLAGVGGDGVVDGSVPPPAAALTPSLEATFVHAFYDAIAPHFSATRHSTWPRVEAYLSSLPVGSVVVDVGCGNGKYMGSTPQGRICITGCDRSEPLVGIAAGKGHEAAVADAVLPPYRAGSADVAMAIALLHHLSTRPRRTAVIKGLLNTVRPGGHVLIYVWAQEQGVESKRVFGAQDVLVPWCLHRKFLEGGGGASSSPGGDSGGGDSALDSVLASLTGIGATMDEGRNAIVVQRYCHVYSSGELESLCAEAAGEMGAEWALSPDVLARAVAGKAADEGRKQHGTVAPPLSSLQPSGRPGDLATGSVEASAIPDSAVAPVRGARAKGKGKACAGAQDVDAITARLVEHAQRLCTAGVPAASSPRMTVTALDLWWERDNWCILLRKEGVGGGGAGAEG